VKQPQWRQRIIEEEQKRYKLQQKAKQMKSPALAKDYSMSSSQLARANHDALQDFLKTNYDKEFRNAAEIKAKMQGQSFQIAHHDKPSAADEFHRAQANNNHGYAQVGNSQDSLAYGERRRNAAEMRSRIKGKMLEGNIQGFF
jgi:hypothetical protein